MKVAASFIGIFLSLALASALFLKEGDVVRAPSANGDAVVSCTLEDDANPIPDSCIGGETKSLTFSEDTTTMVGNADVNGVIIYTTNSDTTLSSSNAGVLSISSVGDCD